MTDKNIILSLIVFHDNPIFQAFFLLLFTFVKIQLNLVLEEYLLHIFSLGLSRNMLLFYSYNLRCKFVDSLIQCRNDSSITLVSEISR